MALLTMATDFLSPIFFSSTPSLASCCNFFTISSTCKMFKVNKYKHKVNKHYLLHLQAMLSLKFNKDI